MIKRPVPFKLIWPILKTRPIIYGGVIWVCFALCFTVFSAIIVITTEEPYENYDTQSILDNGITVSAKVINIKPRTNITVNGEHPQLISYEYTMNGSHKFDKFQSFDSAEIFELKTGDSIDVKVLNGESVPVKFTTWEFPSYIFVLISSAGLLIGCIFLFIAIFPLLKIFRLYRGGIVKEGIITSIGVSQGLPVSGIGRKVMVDYYHESANGQKIYDNSFTLDFSILGEKKVGDTLKILVAANDESKSCLMPKGLQ